MKLKRLLFPLLTLLLVLLLLPRAQAEEVAHEREGVHHHRRSVRAGAA